MKNITALRILVIIFFSFSLSYKAGCQEEERERNYGLSFGTQFGFIHGQSFEYVYPVPGSTGGELLSELIWDMKPVFYYGFQLDFGRIDLMKGPGFFASISFKSGVPADSGVMEDRDWMYPAPNSSLTRFSTHTNKTSELYWLDAYIGASIPVKNYLFIKPFIAGSWMSFSFSGRDGYGIYHDKNPPGLLFSGIVINYKQDWLLVAAGFSIGTKILAPFSFELSFQISPFTYCAATDNHILGNTIFKDFTAWGLFLEPAGSFSFTAGKIEFSLEAAYRYIGRTTGSSYINENAAGFYKSPNKGGAGLSLFDLRFLVKLNI